jgi:hemerythrin
MVFILNILDRLNMTQVLWNNDYCIGIKTIDKQHKKLFDIMNQLYVASEQERDIKDILELFTELKSYTKYHFEEEEQHFSTLLPSEREAHKKEHVFFICELDKSVQQSIRIGALSLELLYFLNDWLINHIQIEDQKYT